jgi:hypothetical protein
MVNAWLSHVKATMKLHKGKPFKIVLKLAKKTYKSVANVVHKKAKTSKKRPGKGKRKKRGKKKSAKRRRRR